MNYNVTIRTVDGKLKTVTINAPSENDAIRQVREREGISFSPDSSSLTLTDDDPTIFEIKPSSDSPETPSAHTGASKYEMIEEIDLGPALDAPQNLDATKDLYLQKAYASSDEAQKYLGLEQSEFQNLIDSGNLRVHRRLFKSCFLTEDLLQLKQELEDMPELKSRFAPADGESWLRAADAKVELGLSEHQFHLLMEHELRLYWPLTDPHFLASHIQTLKEDIALSKDYFVDVENQSRAAASRKSRERFISYLCLPLAMGMLLLSYLAIIHITAPSWIAIQEASLPLATSEQLSSANLGTKVRVKGKIHRQEDARTDPLLAHAAGGTPVAHARVDSSPFVARQTFEKHENGDSYEWRIVQRHEPAVLLDIDGENEKVRILAGYDIKSPRRTFGERFSDKIISYDQEVWLYGIVEWPSLTVERPEKGVDAPKDIPEIKTIYISTITQADFIFKERICLILACLPGLAIATIAVYLVCAFFDIHRRT